MSLSYEKRLVSGKGPSNRGYHATVLADSRLFVFGGFNGSEVFEGKQIVFSGCSRANNWIQRCICVRFSRLCIFGPGKNRARLS